MTDVNSYDEHAQQYARFVDSDRDLIIRELVIPRMLDLLGDVTSQSVLDAGCGEGRLARRLAGRGARVVGVDVAQSLIDIASSTPGDAAISYECFNLSLPPPDRFLGAFDLVISNMVLDDVPDVDTFIRNVCRMAKPSSRIVVSKGNPYSAVARGKVTSYFDSGRRVPYRGLAGVGVHVDYHHHTLEETIGAFSDGGFVLRRLSDLEPPPDLVNHAAPETREQFGRLYRFPFVMLLEFIRGHR